MAQKADGTVYINSLMDTSGFKAGSRDIESAAKRMASRVAGVIASAFAVKQLVQFGKEAVELGSALSEVQNVVDVTFGNLSKEVDDFAKNAITQFGLSETAAKQYTSTMGAMLKSMGLTTREAADMSMSMTGLAADMASFYNLDAEDAFYKIRAGISGETEPLKQLGINMSVANLEAFALAKGINKSYNAMTQQEQAVLRYNYLLSVTADAQGDFARTSESWANQTRVLSEQFKAIKATIGQGLINVLTPVLKVINTLLAKLATLANAFKSFTELITGNMSSGSTGGAAAGLVSADMADGYNQAADGAESFAGATQDAAKATEKAEKAAKGYLSPLDEINKFQADAEDMSDALMPDAGGTGQTIADAVNNVDYGAVAEGETVIDELDKKWVGLFNNIQQAVQPTIDSLKRLWNEGLSELGDFAWTALKDFYEGFLVPVGKWVLGKGLPRLVDALNEGLKNVDFERINNALKRLWDVLAPFAINVGEGLLWFWENVLVPLGTWTANEVVPRFLDTLSIALGSINNILAALQPLFQWFWDSVLKPIAEWTGGMFLQIWDGINGALQRFSDWCKEHPVAVQNMAIIIGSFFASFKITQLLLEFGRFLELLGGVPGIVSVLSGLIGTILNPFTLAIGGAIAAGVLLYKNWDDISAAAIELKNKIEEKFKGIRDAIANKIEDAKIAISEKWTEITSKTKEAWTSIKKTVTSKAKALKEDLIDKWTTIKSKTKEVWDTVTSNLSEKWETLKTTAQTKFTDIKDHIGTVWEDVKSNTSETWDTIKSTVSKLAKEAWDAIKGAFSDVFDTMKGVGGDVIDGITKGFSKAWNSLTKWVDDIWDAIVGAFDNIYNTMKGIGSNIISGLIKGLSDMWENLTSWAHSITSLLCFNVSGGSGYNSSGVAEIYSMPSGRPIYPVPDIPYLAKGAVIPPNAQFMAVLGDQRNGRNLEMPEDLLRKIIREENARNQQSGNSSYHFTAQINRKTLFDQVIEEAVLRQTVYGRNPFELG